MGIATIGILSVREMMVSKWQLPCDFTFPRPFADSTLNSFHCTATGNCPSTVTQPCTGWTPTTGAWKGKGGSCATWGWTGPWCYVSKDYHGLFDEFIKPSDTYPGHFFMPCKFADPVSRAPVKGSGTRFHDAKNEITLFFLPRGRQICTGGDAMVGRDPSEPDNNQGFHASGFLICFICIEESYSVSSVA